MRLPILSAHVFRAGCSLPTWNLHLRPWAELKGFLFSRKACQGDDWLSHKKPLILHLCQGNPQILWAGNRVNMQKIQVAVPEIRVATTSYLNSRQKYCILFFKLKE